MPPCWRPTSLRTFAPTSHRRLRATPHSHASPAPSLTPCVRTRCPNVLAPSNTTRPGRESREDRSVLQLLCPRLRAPDTVAGRTGEDCRPVGSRLGERPCHRRGCAPAGRPEKLVDTVPHRALRRHGGYSSPAVLRQPHPRRRALLAVVHLLLPRWSPRTAGGRHASPRVLPPWRLLPTGHAPPAAPTTCPASRSAPPAVPTGRDALPAALAPCPTGRSMRQAMENWEEREAGDGELETEKR